MKNIRCIIIDDELPSIKSLKWELDSLEFAVEILATCQSAKVGIDAITALQPDLVFLDIEMPHMNGFEMLTHLSRHNFQVIFTTAYDEYAIKAFKINACDYLLKPIDNDLLKQALTRFYEFQINTDIGTKLEGLFETMRTQKQGFSKLTISTMEGLEFVKIDTITRCESSSNYTFLFTSDGKKRMISKTLGEVHKSLEGENFYRVHKSHLVNVSYIHKYIRGKTGELILDDGSSVPVSRSKKDFLDEI